jgi:hypothetical protein
MSGRPIATTGPGWTLRRLGTGRLLGASSLRIDADGRPWLGRASRTWRPLLVDRPGRRAIRRVATVETPDPSAGRVLTASVQTPAGRFFLDPPADPMLLPTAPGSVFVVHIALVSSGFRVARRPVPPRILARAIRCCPEWRGRPVLVVTVGTPGGDPAAAPLMAALAVALEVPVLAADAGVYAGARSLITGGSFLRWNPPQARAAGAPATVRLGHTLPAAGTVRPRSARTRSAPLAAARREPVAAPQVPTPVPVATLVPVGVPVPTSTPVPVRWEAPVPAAGLPAEKTPTVAPVPEPAPAPEPPQQPEPARAPSGAQPRDRALSRSFSQQAAAAPLADFLSGSSLAASPISAMARAGAADGVPAAAEPTVAMQASATSTSVADTSAMEPPGTAVELPGRQAVPVSAHLRSMPSIRVPAVRQAEPLPELPVEPALSAPEPVGAAYGSPEPRPAAVGQVPAQSSGEARASDGAAQVDAQRRVAGAEWIRLVPSAGHQDRERLRNLLGWRYEAHARAVNSVLALQPGLRATAGQDDLLAGLVAVRAHLSTTGPDVDMLLRGEPPTENGSSAVTASGGVAIDLVGAELLGRCAASGLGRLPVVVGPVFRPGRPDKAVLAQYRSGAVLVEPAFTEARLGRCAPVGSTVEYAIWSSSGRRTDRLDSTDAGGDPGLPRVLFRAGVHFVVLGVDEPNGSGLPRVLLREVPGPAALDERADERVRQRLRETVELSVLTGGDAPDAPQWRLPIGVRSGAAPFIVTARQGPE